MLGDLSLDILGAEPKYPPVNNLDYLSVDTDKYDNYPSDNNSVRIQPKLADLWNHNKAETGLNLIPNTPICPMGKNAEETPVVVDDIVREAKKAMMSGLKGTELSAHLRVRFSPDSIVSAKDEMVKLSEEQGLLGNVYIDASAFTNAKEAESFMASHRTRLAEYLVVNESKIGSDVACFLANKFHKNVVASINYNEDLFKKYKTHLVGDSRIASSFVIDSKESLRKAFLAVPEPEKRAVVAHAKKKISKEVAVKEINEMAENKRANSKIAEDELSFRNVLPILEFARENLSKGKTGSAIKEMLRGKYAAVDLKEAARYLAVLASRDVLPEHIDTLISTNKISKMIGKELKRIAKENPFKVAQFEEQQKPERQIGVQGHYYPLTGKSSNHLAEHVTAAAISLRKGNDLEKVKGELLEKKLSSEDADRVLLDAVKDYNGISAGVKANIFAPQPKKKVVADLPERQTLPAEETIVPATQEFMNFFAGASFDIPVDDAYDMSPLNIGGLDQKSGIDGVL